MIEELPQVHGTACHSYAMMPKEQSGTCYHSNSIALHYTNHREIMVTRHGVSL